MDLKPNVTIVLQPSEAIQLLNMFKELDKDKDIVRKCEGQLEKSIPIDKFKSSDLKELRDYRFEETNYMDQLTSMFGRIYSLPISANEKEELAGIISDTINTAVRRISKQGRERIAKSEFKVKK
jgi:hypothetical protein